jgi:hypothetical protein
MFTNEFYAQSINSFMSRGLSNMAKLSITRLICSTLILALTVAGVPQRASAAQVDTQTLIQDGGGAARVTRLQAQLSRRDVQRAMISLGVNPVAASERVAGLTDDEIVRLEHELDKLPAGGDGGILEILGVVFLVLIILDLVGVTHVFRSLSK